MLGGCMTSSTTGRMTFALVIPTLNEVSGLRGYRRDAIARMNLPDMTDEFWLRRRWFYMNSWELGSSIRAARLGLSVVEIPGTEPARIGGVRKLSILRNGLGGLIQIVHDFVRFRRGSGAHAR